MTASMNTYIAKLEFSSPLATGRGDLWPEGRPLLGSDTLFSALCHGWAALYGEADLTKRLQAFADAPVFLVSSLYVYSAETYYLPVPLVRPADPPAMKYVARLRRLDWLPLAEFRTWVQGGSVQWPKLLAAEPLGYMRTHAVVARSRIAQDRRLNRAAAFGQTCVEFAAQCGGYVIVQTASDDVANRLGRCLTLLGESGIGGRRSTGMGQFTVATGGLVPAANEWDFLSAGSSGWGVTLSLYAPTPEEAGKVAQAGAYGLCERRGWALAGTPRPAAKKAALVMVREGSVAALPCRGRLVDVTPQAWRGDGGHPVWRCGMPIVAPCWRAGGTG